MTVRGHDLFHRLRQDEADAAARARRLATASPWLTSRQGNATKRIGKLYLTVFRKPRGGWSWSIGDSRGVTFSERTYGTEDAAKAAVLAALPADAR